MFFHVAVTSPLYCKANLFQVSLASLLSRILFLPGSSAYSLLPTYRPCSSLWNELEGALSRDSSLQCKQILHSRGLMMGKGEKVGSECLMWSSQRISQVQKTNHFIDFSQLFFVLSFASGSWSPGSARHWLHLVAWVSRWKSMTTPTSFVPPLPKHILQAVQIVSQSFVTVLVS